MFAQILTMMRIELHTLLWRHTMTGPGRRTRAEEKSTENWQEQALLVESGKVDLTYIWKQKPFVRLL